MKKIVKVLEVSVIIISMTTILVACSNSHSNRAVAVGSSSISKSKSINTVIVTIGQKTRSYQVRKNMTLLDFALDQLNAKQSKGFITSVGNLKQDAKSSSYVMFKVDGKESRLGAAAVKLVNDEKIEFYLKKY